MNEPKRVREKRGNGACLKEKRGDGWIRKENRCERWENGRWRMRSKGKTATASTRGNGIKSMRGSERGVRWSHSIPWATCWCSNNSLAAATEAPVGSQLRRPLRQSCNYWKYCSSRTLAVWKKKTFIFFLINFNFNECGCDTSARLQDNGPNWKARC